MAGSDGRSLELYFIDGKPDGMMTAEVFNWTGHVLMSPRTQISAALSRREARYTGVYILLGEQEGVPRAYIGEGEDISSRIKNHDTQKDWWTSAILITSAANNLHKAHVQYLEARLIETARSVAKADLENSNTPKRPSLSESGISNMESFLDYVLLVLPALRVDLFIENKRIRVQDVTPVQPSVMFELISTRLGIRATALLQEGEFVVLQGSITRAEWPHVQTVSSTYGQLYHDLIRRGILVPEGNHLVFTENYAFKSPSAAASVVNARHSNGPADWKVAGTEITYRQWEVDQLLQVVDEQQ